MQLVSKDCFDRYQQILTKEIIRAIKLELERVEAPQELVKQLTGSIAFAVTSLIDDVAGVESDGEAINPLLTFVLENNELEFAGGNSWMHEYVYRILPNVFGDAPPNGGSDDAVS